MQETEDIVTRLELCAAIVTGRGNAAMAATMQEAATTIATIRAEIAALKTVMVAAAEEISAHWQAHCDAEGYGPQNLVRRLEEGIPSEYGYTAGAFATLRVEVETWQKLYRRAINEANGLTNYVEDRPELRGAEKRLDRIEQEARAAIDAAKADKEGA